MDKLAGHPQVTMDKGRINLGKTHAEAYQSHQAGTYVRQHLPPLPSPTNPGIG
jgi:hypothetical protein